MGEALIDIIVTTEGQVDSEVGGAPLNTARTIARLGHQASFLGGISKDSFGGRIKRLLDADRVHIAIPTLMDQPTTIAIASLDENGAATYRFLIQDTAASSVTVDMALAAVDRQARAVHIGTLALVLTPLSDAARAVIDSLGHDQILMVDPNARPSVMTDSEIFNSTLAHAFSRADVIKVSGDDLDFLYPHLSGHEATQHIQSSTGAAVLFTDGARAVEVHVGGSVRILDVPKVPVVDTVGAGDSFSGGFLSYWVGQDWSRSDLHDIDRVAEAAQYGIQVAGLTCQKIGAQPPFARELSSR